MICNKSAEKLKNESDLLRGESAQGRTTHDKKNARRSLPSESSCEAFAENLKSGLELPRKDSPDVEVKEDQKNGSEPPQTELLNDKTAKDRKDERFCGDLLEDLMLESSSEPSLNDAHEINGVPQNGSQWDH
jgi:hypothetical protein